MFTVVITEKGGEQRRLDFDKSEDEQQQLPSSDRPVHAGYCFTQRRTASSTEA